MRTHPDYTQPPLSTFIHEISLGKAEKAELALWLASSKASFITGSYYPIDGGYLAQ